MDRQIEDSYCLAVLSTLYIYSLINYVVGVIIAMRSIKIFNITPSGALLFEDNATLREGSLEGFRIDTCIRSRHIFWTLIPNRIDCSVSKNCKVRYRQIEILTKMVSLGVLTINIPEMAASDLFSQSEKQGLGTVSLSQENFKIIDLVNNRQLLPKFYKRFRHAQGELVQLAEQIVVRVSCEGGQAYLPLKLQRIDHYFQFQEPKSLAKLIYDNMKTSLEVVSLKFNLGTDKYECEAILNTQLQKEILKNGWGRLCIRKISRIDPAVINEYQRIENKARKTHQGIFEKPIEMISLIFTRSNTVGRVEQVIEGFIFLIRTGDNSTIKFSLQKVSCPIENQVGAFECRQFARRHLIGKQVTISNNNSSQASQQGSMVLCSDNKDFQILLLEKGYAFINEELRGSMETIKLELLEARVKEKRLGIYSNKMGTALYENLTISHRNKDKLVKQNMIEGKRKYLKSVSNNVDCVISSIIDRMTYVVRIDCDKKYIRVKLDGVQRPSLSPALKEVALINEQAKEFTFRNFNQRSAKVTLTDYDPVLNNFIGVLSLSSPQQNKKKKTFQELLLSEGLVYLTGSFDDSWIQSEERAISRAVNIWQQKLKQLTRNNLFENQPHEFQGKVSWLEDGCTAFIQPDSVRDQLDEVHEQINNSTLPKLGNVGPGHLCAVQFEGEYYRARILAIQKQKATIFFIDWGNKVQRSLNSLYEIPKRLHYVPPLCCEVNLDIVKPIKKTKKEPETLLRARELLVDSEVRVSKVYERTVDLFIGPKNMSLSLVEQGILKADLTKISDEAARNNIHGIMENLRKQLVGIWEYDESEDEGEDEEKYESDWVVM